MIKVGAVNHNGQDDDDDDDVDDDDDDDDGDDDDCQGVIGLTSAVVDNTVPGKLCKDCHQQQHLINKMVIIQDY